MWLFMCIGLIRQERSFPLIYLMRNCLITHPVKGANLRSGAYLLDVPKKEIVIAFQMYCFQEPLQSLWFDFALKKSHWMTIFTHRNCQQEWCGLLVYCRWVDERKINLYDSVLCISKIWVKCLLKILRTQWDKTWILGGFNHPVMQMSTHKTSNPRTQSI